MLSAINQKTTDRSSTPDANTYLYILTCRVLPALLVFLLLATPTASFADDLVSGDHGPETPKILEDQIDDTDPEIPGFGHADTTHQFLSTGVESLSQRIDTFFGDDRVYDEATGTYLQVRGSVIHSRSGEIDTDGRFRLKIDLPQMKKKANLSLESGDDKDDESFNRVTTGSSLADELEDSDVSASLQFFIKEKKRWNLSIRPGVKFSDPIESFIKLRFRRTQSLGEVWLSRGTIEVGHYSRRGWENEWVLDLERDVGKKSFFRSTSSVLWREDYPGNQFLKQTFLVTQILNRRQSIAYEIGTRAETRPHLRDTAYFGSIRYRRNIHRGWLFFELEPQMLFARENNFKAEPALALTLEILLGAKYLDK